MSMNVLRRAAGPAAALAACITLVSCGTATQVGTQSAPVAKANQATSACQLVDITGIEQSVKDDPSLLLSKDDLASAGLEGAEPAGSDSYFVAKVTQAGVAKTGIGSLKSSDSDVLYFAVAHGSWSANEVPISQPPPIAGAPRKDPPTYTWQVAVYDPQQVKETKNALAVVFAPDDICFRG